MHGGHKPPTNELADYLVFIGYEVPVNAGVDRTAETIKRLSKSLAKGQGEAGLTDDQRLRWEDLGEHNRHDWRRARDLQPLVPIAPLD